MSYQPKTGAACSCRPGVERDNCPQCEGTGGRIDFAAIRATHRPSIDHGLLSPSGRVSKRARNAALKREGERLFPPGYFSVEVDPVKQRIDRITALERYAKELRDLADRGMSPRKLRAEAQRMEAEAYELKASAND